MDLSSWFDAKTFGQKVDIVRPHTGTCASSVQKLALFSSFANSEHNRAKRGELKSLFDWPRGQGVTRSAALCLSFGDASWLTTKCQRVPDGSAYLGL